MNTQTTERRCVHSDTAQPDNYESSSSSPPAIATLIRRAFALREGRKYQPAIGIYRAILKRIRKPAPLVAGIQSELARCYTLLGQYPKAKSALRKAARRVKKALGPRHPDRALYLHNLAAVCEAEGKCKQSEVYSKQVRAILGRTAERTGVTGLMPWNAAHSFVSALANVARTVGSERQQGV